MIRRALGLLGLVGLAVSTGVAVSAADTKARVDGHVVDGKTGAPLAGATVTVLGEGGHTVSVTTNQKGWFGALGLEPGKVTVTFAARGFQAQSVTCNVPPGETGRFEFRGYRSLMSIGKVKYRCTLEPSTVDQFNLH
jgi:hypothetical protein